MKFICFLLTQMRANTSSIAAKDMKLTTVLHCPMLKLAHIPSLRVCTYEMHVILFMNNLLKEQTMYMFSKRLSKVFNEKKTDAFDNLKK